MKKTQQRIIGIFFLIILELIGRGRVSGNEKLLWLGIVNIFVLLFFIGPIVLNRAKKQGYIHSHDLEKWIKRGKNVLKSYGFSLCSLWFGRELLRYVVLGGGYGELLLSGVLLLSIIYILRKSMHTPHFFRGEKKIHMKKIGFICSGVLSLTFIEKYRTMGAGKYLLALGAGWIFYSVVLIFAGEKLKTFFKNTFRLLFGIMFGVVALWAGGNSVIERYDDHTIVKEVIKEREKIVYVEKNGEDKEEVTIDKSKEEIDSKKEKKEKKENKKRLVLQEIKIKNLEKEIEKLEREKKKTLALVKKVKLNIISSAKTKKEIKTDREEENRLINGTGDFLVEKKELVSFIEIKQKEKKSGYISCQKDECLWKNVCVSLPSHAYCTPGKIDAWQCETDYRESGNTCIIKCPDNMCSFGGVCIERPNNASCVVGDITDAWICNIGYKEFDNTCILENDTEHNTASDFSIDTYKYIKNQNTTVYSILDKIIDKNTETKEEDVFYILKERNNQ